MEGRFSDQPDQAHGNPVNPDKPAITWLVTLCCRRFTDDHRLGQLAVGSISRWADQPSARPAGGSTSRRLDQPIGQLAVSSISRGVDQWKLRKLIVFIE